MTPRSLVLAALVCGGAAARPANAQPVLTTLDSAGDVGRDSDVAYGPNGRAIVSYLDATNGALKVAVCEDVACTQASLRTLDASGTVGGSTSIAFGADGRAFVSYLDASARAVKIARCTDAACTSASVATVEVLARLGQGTALGVGGDGLPIVAYPDPDNGQVRVAHCEDTGCVSVSRTSYAGGGRVGLTVGADGRALVTAETPPTVWVRHCSNAACTAATLAAFPGTPLGTLSEPSITTQFSGLGTLAVVRNGALVQVFYCTDAACSFLATGVSAAEPGVAPAASPASAAPFGYLDLVFFGAPGSEHVKARTCQTPPTGCTTRWIDAPGIGRHPALDLSPEGYGLVSYDDETNGDLRVAYVSGPPPSTFADLVAVPEGASGLTTATIGAYSTYPAYGRRSFETQPSTATSGVDYLPTAGTLTFAPGSAPQSVEVAVVGDTLSEGDEFFFVRLFDALGSGGFSGVNTLATVRIVDDEAGTPSGFAASDVTVVEGSSGTTDAVFEVRLAPPSSATATVAYAAQDFTATAGTDFLATSGTLTFAPGETVKTVAVPVLGDGLPETDELFTLGLSAPSGAYVADFFALGTILDDDTTVSVADASAPEGDAGTSALYVAVRLDGPSSSPVSVDFATQDDTATAGVDYLATAGTLTFAPGTTTLAVTVSLVGDTAFEPDETFRVLLSNPQGGVIADAEGVATIVDDDGVPEAAVPGELHHGSVYAGDLAANAGPVADEDAFRIVQQPFASYEVVVDAASGDLVPVLLERRDAGGTVLQTAVAPGTGSSVALHWRTAGTTAVADETVRVAGACAAACGPDDVYRVRAYETTLRAPRYNNSGSQTTVLLLQNRGAAPVTPVVSFWTQAGALAGTYTAPAPIAPFGLLVLDTSTVAPATSGSLTVAHDAGFGGLAGKAVAVEPATGFSFDTPLELRLP